MSLHPFEETRQVVEEMGLRRAERLAILLNGDEREPTGQEMALANGDGWEWLSRYNTENTLHK